MPQKKKKTNQAAKKTQVKRVQVKKTPAKRMQAKKIPAKKTIRKPVKKLMPLNKELSPEEIIYSVTNDNIIQVSSVQDSETRSGLAEKEMLKKRVDDFKIQINEANIHINTLTQEVAKRNNNLKILSDAYIELKGKFDSRNEDLERFKSNFVLKENVLESLKEDIEKRKKQAIRNNLNIEALYKQLTRTDLKAREITLLNNKLQARCDTLTEELKKKDIEAVHIQENTKILIMNERKKLKAESEQMQAKIWQKEQFLSKKVEHMIMQLKEKDIIIAEKSRKLAQIMNTYRKIKDFVAEVQIPESSRLNIQHPIPPRPSHPSFKQKIKKESPKEIYEEVSEVHPQELKTE
ncbi:MAG: hypothetical protein KAI26_02070, partial [Nanoarchaeota archaeon]|nr:hypothetical protein [Nanoarchaeota archaeon]